jgi:hypothetical protein
LVVPYRQTCIAALVFFGIGGSVSGAFNKARKSGMLEIEEAAQFTWVPDIKQAGTRIRSSASCAAELAAEQIVIAVNNNLGCDLAVIAADEGMRRVVRLI